SHDARTIRVLQQQQITFRPQVEVPPVDFDQLLDLVVTRDFTGHDLVRAVTVDHTHADFTAVGVALWLREHLDGHTAFLRQLRCVDERHRILHHTGEPSPQRSQLQHVHVLVGEFTSRGHGDRGRRLLAERGNDRTQLLGEREIRTYLITDAATRHVHGIRYELTTHR